MPSREAGERSRTTHHTDERRFLVERLWPRGVKKEALELDGWLKDVAPSAALRTWYGHDLARWEEFRRRYRAELDENEAAWAPLLEAARAGTVTLLFSARDVERNSAVVLRDYLTERLSRAPGRAPARRRRART